MVSSYTPRIDPMERRSGKLLRFTAVRELQAKALARATKLAPVSGLTISLDVTLPDVGSPREAVAGLRRVGDNFGARLVDESRKISRPTYDTGLFMSSWKAETRVSDAGKLSVTLRNPVPYARYVHRSGERGRTVVETYIQPMIARRRSELVQDVATLIRRLVQRGRR